MPLGMELGLDQGEFVFDGDPAPPEKRAQPLPNFWPRSIVAKRRAGFSIRRALFRKNVGPLPSIYLYE